MQALYESPQNNFLYVQTWSIQLSCEQGSEKMRILGQYPRYRNRAELSQEYVGHVSQYSSYGRPKCDFALWKKHSKEISIYSWY